MIEEKLDNLSGFFQATDKLILKDEINTGVNKITDRKVQTLKFWKHANKN